MWEKERDIEKEVEKEKKEIWYAERECNTVRGEKRERKRKKCCGNSGILLGICGNANWWHKLVTEKELLVFYDITRKCMSYRYTAHLKNSAS